MREYVAYGLILLVVVGVVVVWRALSAKRKRQFHDRTNYRISDKDDRP